MSTLKDQTAQGLAWGLMNNGVMQVLNIVFGIILARVLSPDDYGLAGELAIFAALATALQESGFITALTNRKNATHDDYNAVFWFNVCCSGLIYIGLWFSAPLIADFFGEPELLCLSRYAFLGFFFASFSIVPRTILFKQMRVKEQSIINIIALLFSGGVGTTMALCGMSYWSIVTQNIVFITTVMGLSWWDAGWKPSFSFHWKPIREMFPFSCKILITNIFNSINNGVFSLLFGHFYNKFLVGQYTQADKWNKMGSNMISGMVQGVAQPMFVQMGDDKERLQRAFRKMLRFTSLISFPAMFGLVLTAPQLIVIAVGEKWLPSAMLMQLLCVAGAFMPIAMLCYQFIISRGKSGVYMWNVISQGLIMIGLLCAIYYYDWGIDLSVFGWTERIDGVVLMVITFVVVYLLWLFIWYVFVRREIGLSLWSVMKDVAPFALIAIVAMVAAGYATYFIDNIYLLFVSRVILGAGIYILIVWITGAKILRESIQYLRKKKNHSED